MLIFPNAIRLHSLGLVMSYYVQVTANLDGQGCLARSAAHQHPFCLLSPFTYMPFFFPGSADLGRPSFSAG